MQARGHGVDCNEVFWVEGSRSGDGAESDGPTAYDCNCAVLDLRGFELREAVADGVELGGGVNYGEWGWVRVGLSAGLLTPVLRGMLVFVECEIDNGD